MKIQAFILDENTLKLEVLDQTLLPDRSEYVEIEGTVDGFNSIKNMLVRGAPCIAAVACLSVLTELNRSADPMDTTDALCAWLDKKRQYLTSARPTAVNLKQALDRLCEFAHEKSHSKVEDVKRDLVEFCLRAIRIGLEANIRLGDLGAELIVETGAANNKTGEFSILTHCNTGALATVGHGTALGVVRSLHARGKLKHAYCTETRPYNQGSRLTAWELVTENIPATLIADNMVAYLMATRQIDAVVVGADRVAANGDTANKIGTLQIAVVAKHYGVPFYVAAPTQSIDLMSKNADAIVIEERPADELRRLNSIQLAPKEINAWNPCFDVTPAALIDRIMTEIGTCKPEGLVKFLESSTDNEDNALF